MNMTDPHPDASRATRKFKTSALICLLILPVLLLYAHTLDAPFILDDYANILENRYIRVSELSPRSLMDAGFNGPSEDRPVANISFALNHFLHGYRPAGYHVVNVLVHLLAGVILYFFVLTTLRLPLTQWPFSAAGQSRLAAAVAFGTAMLWLIHPLQIQSVTYIVQRMNSLATLFLCSASCSMCTREGQSDGASACSFTAASLFPGCSLWAPKKLL